MMLTGSCGGRTPAKAISTQPPCLRWFQPDALNISPRSCRRLETARCNHRSADRPLSVRVCSHSTNGISPAAGGTPRRRQRTYDVVSLGNLCVDIVLPVASLPPSDNGQFHPSATTVLESCGLHQSALLGNQ